MDSLQVYEVLVRQHERMLFAYVLGLVQDLSLAEDVVQDAFIIGYHKLATLKRKEHFAAWLRTIARHEALALLRKRGREVLFEPALLEGMEDIFAVRQEHGETFEDRLEVIEGCFKQLPENLSSVCRLHYLEDQTVNQIAQGLQLQVAAVLKRLQRAREALRECAEKHLNLNPA